MASTNSTSTHKTTPTSTTIKTATKSSSSHPNLLYFVAAFAVILVASWVANISDDAGNAVAALFALLWAVWFLNNSSKIRSLVP